VVPLGVLGAVLATLARGFWNDVYFQVGLLTTIGLAAKSAVLIVEFAKENFDQGQGLAEAVTSAARQRLRPILMTSLAFMGGVLPLAVATGAGSGAQNAVGTGVIGGMLASTFLAILFVPVFFVVVLRYLKVQPREVPGRWVAAPPCPPSMGHTYPQTDGAGAAVPVGVRPSGPEERRPALVAEVRGDERNVPAILAYA
jgi:multidrug efflux pump